MRRRYIGRVAGKTRTGNVTRTNKLITACAIYIEQWEGLHPNQNRGEEVKKTWW